MDTKRLREILQKFSSEDMNYGISIDQAIKEIQELSCDCHIIRDSAVKRVVEQQKIIEELEAKLSTPRLMEECPECGGKVRSLGTSLELYCKTCNGTGKKPSVTPNETCIVCNKPSKLVMCDKCLKKYKKRKNLK